MVEILVVDDNLQLRDTLRTILNKRPGFCVTGEAADGIAASQLAQPFVRTSSSWTWAWRVWTESKRRAGFEPSCRRPS